ncbi:MAG: hypothetical protein QGH21_06220, partial [Candidatus Poseidoniia archaeon]|nr:hypothetical protein [Candidatus Poseidoniia archaeon]
MRQGTAALLAVMVLLTSFSTGSLAPSPTAQPTATPLAAEGGNDTLNRTNTFPFDVLFDDYHEYS